MKMFFIVRFLFRLFLLSTTDSNDPVPNGNHAAMIPNIRDYNGGDNVVQTNNRCAKNIRRYSKHNHRQSKHNLVQVAVAVHNTVLPDAR